MKLLALPLSLALIFGGLPVVIYASAAPKAVHSQRHMHGLGTAHQMGKPVKHRKRGPKPPTIRQVILAALTITHRPVSWEKPLAWIAWQESKNDPRAVDGVLVPLADLRGDTEHAEGLFQVLPTTFRAHALRGYRDIWNPLDNTVASIRYIVGRYRSPDKIPGMYRRENYRGY